MRKYEPIWRKLKKKGHATLSAPPNKHRRIVLAVRKEKTKDIGWKYECQETRKKYKLYDKSKNSILTFTLTPTNSISYSTLTINDL